MGWVRKGAYGGPNDCCKGFGHYTDQNKTNGKYLVDSIQMDWKFEGPKQRINCSRKEYDIFRK